MGGLDEQRELDRRPRLAGLVRVRRGALVRGIARALLYEHIIRFGSPPEPEGALEQHNRGELSPLGRASP